MQDDPGGPTYVVTESEISNSRAKKFSHVYEWKKDTGQQRARLKFDHKNMPLNNGSLNKNFIATMNKVIKRLVTYSTFIELILFGLGENQTKIKK